VPVLLVSFGNRRSCSDSLAIGPPSVMKVAILGRG
jgi:hypothetical protein